MLDINSIKGIDSKRANFAFKCVKEVESKHKNYDSYIKKMPMLIKTNGLGQTLAFYYSKSEPAYNLILEQIRDYFKLRGIKSGLNSNEGLLNFITAQNSSDYRNITQEIMMLLNWWRRFVDGVLED